MHYVIQDLNIKPKNKHISTCLKYQDGICLSPNFVKELVSSVISFVYRDVDIREMEKEYKERGLSEYESITSIFQDACDFFIKKKVPKGQFSELLLSTLLKTYFQAIPFVFKMKVTTNTELERNGADAIHIAKHDEPNKYKIYLGEAKTYTSGFSNAFRDAQKSIFSTLNNILNERKIYVRNRTLFEDGFSELFEAWVNGSDDKFEINLVCIITYCVKDEIELSLKSSETYSNFMKIIKSNTNLIKEKTFNKFSSNLHFARLHYIFFPIDDLDNLIEMFSNKLSK